MFSPPTVLASQQHMIREAGYDVELPVDVKDYDLQGLLFKRRGGIGRVFGWKPRLFTLYRGVLCYYECDAIEGMDRTRPRGVLRLKGCGLQVICGGKDGPEQVQEKLSLYPVDEGSEAIGEDGPMGGHCGPLSANHTAPTSATAAVSTLTASTTGCASAHNSPNPHTTTTTTTATHTHTHTTPATTTKQPLSLPSLSTSMLLPSMIPSLPSSDDRAPTDHIFTLISATDDIVWRLCAASKKDHDEWMRALAPFIGDPPALDQAAKLSAVVDSISSASDASSCSSTPSPLPVPTSFRFPLLRKKSDDSLPLGEGGISMRFRFPYRRRHSDEVSVTNEPTPSNDTQKPPSPLYLKAPGVADASPPGGASGATSSGTTASVHNGGNTIQSHAAAHGKGPMCMPTPQPPVASATTTATTTTDASMAIITHHRVASSSPPPPPPPPTSSSTAALSSSSSSSPVPPSSPPPPPPTASSSSSASASSSSSSSSASTTMAEKATAALSLAASLRPRITLPTSPRILSAFNMACTSNNTAHNTTTNNNTLPLTASACSVDGGGGGGSGGSGGGIITIDDDASLQLSGSTCVPPLDSPRSVYGTHAHTHTHAHKPPSPHPLCVEHFRLTRTHVYVVLVGVNVVVALVKWGGPAVWVPLWLLLNVCVKWSLDHTLWMRTNGVFRRFSESAVIGAKSKVLRRYHTWVRKFTKRRRNPRPEPRPIKAVIEPEVEAARHHVRFCIPKVPSQMPPIGSSVPRRGPGDGSPSAHTWAPCLGTHLKVRGERYSRHRSAKVSSGPALYQLLHFELYASPHRVHHVASLMTDLPPTQHDKDVPSHIPKLLIINWQLPSDPPTIFAADDGPGYNCVFYFAIRDETVEALRDVDSAAPAVRLLSEFCRFAPDNTEWKGRLKSLAYCSQLGGMQGLPPLIEKCNGKPVLLNKSATYYKGKGYVEVDINAHRFSYPARKGLHFMQEKVKDVSFDVAFVIEGRSEDELPEMVLGAGTFDRMSWTSALQLEY